MPTQVRPKQNILLGSYYALLTSVVACCAAASAKYVSTDISPFVIICIQYGICMATLTPSLLKEGVASIQTDRHRLHFIRGASGLLSFISYYLALKNIPLIDASLLRNTSPLCVPFILIIWLNIKLPIVRWLGIIIGFIGIALILKPTSSGISLWHLVGLSSGFFLAISMTTTRRLAASESTNTIIFYYFCYAFFLSLPFAIYTWTPVPLNKIPFLIFIGLSIFFTMKFYTKAFSYAKASVISPISYFGVIFSGILGWLIWNHRPDILAYAGIILVILGSLISLFSEPKTDSD